MHDGIDVRRWERLYTSIFLALERLRQGDHEVEDCLGYLPILCLKTNKQKKQKE